MQDLTLLSTTGKYHICGEQGYWQYCHCEDAPRNTYKYTFKRIRRGNLRSKKLTLSEEQTKKRVWEEVTPEQLKIDLEVLEAVRERYTA